MILRLPRFGGRVSATLWVMAGLFSSGCQEQIPVDPNDPTEAGAMQPEVIRRDLQSASDALQERVFKGEITDKQYQAYMADYADQMLSKIQPQSVSSSEAWKYGEAYRTARKWPEAAKLFQTAVDNAPNEDRFVNDSLHLAEAEAYLGKVPDALAHVKSTFKAKPPEKAPILTGTLYQVVPAARGKGDDVELAQVLEQTVKQAEECLVDPKSDAGKAFLFARPFQIKEAWRTILELLQSSGRADLAEQAAKRRDADPQSRTL